MDKMLLFQNQIERISEEPIQCHANHYFVNTIIDFRWLRGVDMYISPCSLVSAQLSCLPMY